MRNLFYAIVLVGLMLSAIPSTFSQNLGTGIYDVRFNMNNYDCNSRELFVDIEIRTNAQSPDATFNLTDQNYRFSWNRAAVNGLPSLVQNGDPNPASGPMYISDELIITGFISYQGTNTLYSAHTIVGSVDTVGTVNINFAGGDGFPVPKDMWIKVSQLRFVINSGSPCLDLMWHDHSVFPPTFIGQKEGGQLFEVNEGTYGQFNMCFEPTCPLPIELISFEGKEVDCENALQWQTLTETDNEYFILERSNDGRNFQTIAQIPGAGTSTDINSYSYLDKNITVNNYYRLTQVDSDGGKYTFETIYLKSSCLEGILEDIIELYPNPITTDETLYIEFFNDELSTNGIIVVQDALGRIVDRAPVGLAEGPNRLAYNPSNLVSGSYFLFIERNGWTSDTKKFVKVD